MQTTGYSIITQRWLFVIAETLRQGIVGDPVQVSNEETLKCKTKSGSKRLKTAEK
jgi:hypothetical protein